MTIDYHITIGARLTDQQKQHIEKILQSTFSEVDRLYNKWNPHSEISQINLLQAHEQLLLSPEMQNFFRKIDKLVALSGGRFDPTIEPLQNLWKRKFREGLIPTEDEIALLKPYIGWDKFHVADGVLYKDHSLCQIDLGGIAKGLAVDLLVERINRAGFPNVLVEWGGEIRALGEHPNHRPWSVSIRNLEDANPKNALSRIDLKERSVATSGDYHQFWSVTTSDGKQHHYCHIFNPLTLRPVDIRKGSVASASIFAHDCVTADGLAKVLMMFDSAEEAQRWVTGVQNEIPSLDYLIVTREN